MAKLDTSIKAFPLSWPDNWPRTAPADRLGHSAYKVSANKARAQLVDELRKLGAEDVIISSNAEVRPDGMPYANAARRAEKDPGVAVFFTMDGKPNSMARDAYVRLDDNLRMLGLALKDMRSLRLHGGDFMMRAAFSGFAALPPPPTCWQVLGIAPLKRDDSEARNKIIAAHRELYRSASASQNGEHLQAQLNAARDEALNLIGEA
jgi:hypothetical protein